MMHYIICIYGFRHAASCYPISHINQYHTILKLWLWKNTTTPHIIRKCTALLLYLSILGLTYRDKRLLWWLTIHSYYTFQRKETWKSIRHDGCKRSLTLPSQKSAGLANKPQFLMHYLTVLSFMILWIVVLILSPYVLDPSCSIPFVANSILMMLRLQTMLPSSISITSWGATLASEVLLLMWQPVSLQK